VAFIEHEVLQDPCERYPRIAGAFWRETLIDAAIFGEWIVNIGQREAYARACHLLCEMMTRMKAVGLAQDQSCAFPGAQGELDDAIGISHVYADRTLQEIRAAGLMRLSNKVLTVLDWEGLKRVGEFDPTYLHQPNGQRAAADPGSERGAAS
jgi:hypothetical protein